jgi:hypothetical protein
MQSEETENRENKRLSDSLQNFIQGNSLSLKSLAESIDVKYSSLRTEFNRNAFSIITLNKIFKFVKAQIGDLPPDLDQVVSHWTDEMDREQVQRVLAEKFSVTVTKPRIRAINPVDIKNRVVIVSSLKERAESFSQIQRFENEVDLLMGELKQGDAYFYLSIDRRPLEYEPRSFDLRQIIYLSMKAGAQFHYLFPSTEVINKLRARGLTGFASGDSMNDDFLMFQKNLKSVADQNPNGVKIEDHLFYHSLQGDCTPFLVPQHKFILFSIENVNTERVTESYAVVPIVDGGLNLPLGTDFSNQFLAFLQNELGVHELWSYRRSKNAPKSTRTKTAKPKIKPRTRKGKRED